MSYKPAGKKNRQGKKNKNQKKQNPTPTFPPAKQYLQNVRI